MAIQTGTDDNHRECSARTIYRIDGQEVSEDEFNLRVGEWAMSDWKVAERSQDVVCKPAADNMTPDPLRELEHRVCREMQGFGERVYAVAEEKNTPGEKSAEHRKPGARYRKRPVVVSAIQWNGSNTDEVSDFIGTTPLFGDLPDAAGIGVCIQTREGNMWAYPGDWIIRGVKGEFYPCKPDVFAATYEPVELLELLRKGRGEDAEEAPVLADPPPDK